MSNVSGNHPSIQPANNNAPVTAQPALSPEMAKGVNELKSQLKKLRVVHQEYQNRLDLQKLFLPLRYVQAPIVRHFFAVLSHVGQADDVFRAFKHAVGRMETLLNKLEEWIQEIEQTGAQTGTPNWEKKVEDWNEHFVTIRDECIQMDLIWRNFLERLDRAKFKIKNATTFGAL